jgi:hypothetical protein
MAAAFIVTAASWLWSMASTTASNSDATLDRRCKNVGLVRRRHGLCRGVFVDAKALIGRIIDRVQLTVVRWCAGNRATVGLREQVTDSAERKKRLGRTGVARSGTA